MRIAIVCGLTALLVAACTVEHTELSVGDANRAYIVPMLCEKQSQCAPSSFAATYPGGVEECKTKLLAAVTAKEGDQGKLTNCTNGDYQTCRADFFATQCPTDPAANGLPTERPASCTKC